MVFRKTARFGTPEVFALIGALSFFVARFVPVLRVPFLCPVQRFFGIPCPSCGMTHAFVGMAHGDIRSALAASPFGALLAAAAWLYALADLGRMAVCAPFPELEPRTQRALALAGLSGLAVNWFYLVVKAIT